MDCLFFNQASFSVLNKASDYLITRRVSTIIEGRLLTLLSGWPVFDLNHIFHAQPSTTVPDTKGSQRDDGWNVFLVSDGIGGMLQVSGRTR